MHQQPFTLIHIGKCGGSSVRTALTNAHIQFDCVHITPATYEPERRYIILIRNPVARFISAFNWRRKLVCDEGSQRDRFAGEYELLKKHSTVASFVEHLETFDPTHQYIHHINEDMHFYLGDFLQHTDPSQIIAVITTETLATDIERLFNIRNMPHEKENHGHRISLSPSQYTKIKQYLHKDYACIEILNQHGLLSPAQYEALSK